MRVEDILKARQPQHDLSRLTLVQAHPARLHEWAMSLPKVNVGESSRRIYQTLQELNRLRIDTRSRLGLLEALRPTVYFLCESLARHYLDQPAALPEKASKVATLAQAMQNHLATGYKAVCLELLQHAQESDSQRLLALACHRAISDLSATLVRCMQLYLGPTPRTWQELHALHALAQKYALQTQTINDPTRQHRVDSNIDDAYIRALLMATCRPHQMRQNDIMLTYVRSETWTSLVHIQRDDGISGLHFFDPHSDAPPSQRRQSGENWVLSCTSLVESLQDMLAQQANSPLRVDPHKQLNQDLLRHLIHAWGDLSARGFKRIGGAGRIMLSIGMSATHYFLGGEVEFEASLHGDRSTPSATDEFKERLHSAQIAVDPWGSGHYFGEANAEGVLGDIEFVGRRNDQGPVYEKHPCHIVNTSPGGYGLRWDAPMPTAVRTGELVGLTESEQKHASLGCIRWLQQLPGAGAFLGVEVLAPQVTPCGVRLLRQNTEQGEFLRAFFIPEMSSIQRPASLIVPNLIFRTGARVELSLAGATQMQDLGRLIRSSPSFCQFELGQHPRKTQRPAAPQEEDFDTIWANL